MMTAAAARYLQRADDELVRAIVELELQHAEGVAEREYVRLLTAYRRSLKDVFGVGAQTEAGAA